MHKSRREGALVRGRVCDSSSVGRILDDTNLENPVSTLLITILGRCFDHCGASLSEQHVVDLIFRHAHKPCTHGARFVIVWWC